MEQIFEVIQTPAQPVLSIRKITSVAQLPQLIGSVFHDIIDYLSEKGLQPADAPFACYYNMDMENLDVEIGFPVMAALPGRGEIKSGEIPAGNKAATLYVGPYQDMGPTYEAMNKWVTDNGYEATGVVYELYYNSPMEVPENQLLTKIVFLLK